MILGVDTGGTFTDFVFIDAEGIRTHKVLSTPKAPELAILQGIAELDIDVEQLRIVHGSTVATNAVLEKKGVRCCFITNEGFTDMLTIGRQARKELYNLNPVAEEPPVPKELCLGVTERISAQGEQLKALTDQALQSLREKLEQLKPDAVAINLLFSFLDDKSEKQLAAIIPEGIFISRSSQVLAEYKEYERGMATWLNAYVGPLVGGYLARLSQGVKAQSVSVMQSSGGTIALDQAAQQAVRMLLSGPAGGLMGALHMGKQAGFEKLLTLDMGGTSTDVSLLDGAVSLTTEGKIGDYPVAVSMVDMHTIGAGGGSLAQVDAGGLLNVGPESAGAMPGPVCYGKGGTQVTVTDANLYLGRLSSEHFLGGKMSLDSGAASQAIEKLAMDLKCSTQQAAEGVINIANEHMAKALRVISIQRGIDPRPYALMSFGGAGALHICALADMLEMKTALVPVCSGVLSAFGMLVAPRSRQLSKSIVVNLDQACLQSIKADFAKLVQQGEAELLAEGVLKEQLRQEYWVDLRYVGQSYTLPIVWKGDLASVKEHATKSFNAMHKQRYGHAMDLPVELVTLRVALTAEVSQQGLQQAALKTEGASKLRQVKSVEGRMAIFQRTDLTPGIVIEGEALIVETVATTYLAKGWKCKVDDFGNLIFNKIEAG